MTLKAMTPARLRQNPGSESGRKTVAWGSLSERSLLPFLLANPNLSVIWMVCTRSRSSLGVDVAGVAAANDETVRLLLLFPNELTDLSSPVASSVSHWTGSQVGMQGVTKALNCTTSDDGNLKASKYDMRTWNRNEYYLTICIFDDNKYSYSRL